MSIYQTRRTFKSLIYAFILCLSFPSKPAQSVATLPAFNYSVKDIKCLALNIYHEARGESVLGQLAVAQVTINRTRDPRWPNTICEVVYQRAQFSWTLFPQKSVKAPEHIAMIALFSNHVLKNFRATHYHNYTVNPKWNKKMKYRVIIGNHIFYV